MRKNGQVALFIILGIIALIATLIATQTLRPPPLTEQKMRTPSSIRTVENAFHACIDRTTRTTIKHQALQGGWLEPSPAITLTPLPVSIAYENGIVHLPSAEEMEADLATRLPSILRTCIDDVEEDAAAKGVHIAEAQAVVNATINADSVRVAISYPARFTEGAITVSARPQTVLAQQRIGRLHDAAESIVLQTMRHPDAIPLSDIMNLPYEVNLLGVYGTVAVYALADLGSVEPALFSFGVKIPESEKLELGRPDWVRLESLVIDAGKRFAGSIQAQSPLDRALRYSSDTPWLAVDAVTGTLSADVDARYKGLHFVTLTASDDTGLSVSGTVEVLVR